MRAVGWGDGGVGEQAESEGALPSTETRGIDGPPAAHEQPLLLFSLCRKRRGDGTISVQEGKAAVYGLTYKIYYLSVF